MAVVGSASTGGFDSFSESKDDAITAKVVDPAASDTVAQDQPEVDVQEAVETAHVRAKQPLPDLAKMNLAQLQDYAAKMQTEFVQASLAYEEAQNQAVQASVAADQAEGEADAAEKESVRVRTEFRTNIVSNYSSRINDSPTLQLLSHEGDVSELIDELGAIQTVRELRTSSVKEVDTAVAKADELSQKAQKLRDAATVAEDDAEYLLDDIQGRASRVATAASKSLLNSDDGKTLFASAEQEARNKAALHEWRSYLDLLDKAKVVPPSADTIIDPADLPYGLEPLRGAGGGSLTGVAAKKYQKQTITVLSKETIAAVSSAFAEVGSPFVVGNEGPDTYDCSGLTSAVYGDNGYELPVAEPVNQYKHTRLVTRENAQVGDLVFFTEPGLGVQHVGINLGGDLMLAADGSAQQVGVQEFPSKPYAFGRVTLPLNTKGGEPSLNKPPKTDTEAISRCGVDPAALTGTGMVYPMKEGAYRFTSSFGEAGPHWSSGYHTGLDFAAPAGTAVLAAKSGTVTVSKSSWGGPNFVTIDHGDELKTAYAHMSQVLVKTGDVVEAGDLIGAVGEEGNATGPHLHFEVLVSDIKVDPMLFLSGTGSGQAGWGGFTNGMVPTQNLCSLSINASHRLRCDAAAAFNSMAAAYQEDMGSSLCITDSYRTYAAQVKLYAQKPSLAAVPGTSNHGWALAVDLCGGVESWGSEAHEWMVSNAARFGWLNPAWARRGGGREEPWHWEFGSIS